MLVSALVLVSRSENPFQTDRTARASDSMAIPVTNPPPPEKLDSP
jgi:hypothetical protein